MSVCCCIRPSSSPSLCTGHPTVLKLSHLECLTSPHYPASPWPHDLKANSSLLAPSCSHNPASFSSEHEPQWEGMWFLSLCVCLSFPMIMSTPWSLLCFLWFCILSTKNRHVLGTPYRFAGWRWTSNWSRVFKWKCKSVEKKEVK